MPLPIYDNAFIRYASQSSAYAAAIITDYLAPLLAIRSVLDVGCASGTWLHAWSAHGIGDFHGVDGDYVENNLLEIPRARFTPVDLNCGFDLGRQYDLVQSLEVAEHLTPRASMTFVDCIARHARRFVLFSAAPPGQGGECHINERPYDFWRSALAKHGFAAIDAVRPVIRRDTKISYWYRYNTFLYARREELARDDFERRLLDLVAPEGEMLADISPFSFQIRKAIVRRLPRGLQDGAARFKAKVMPTGRL